MSIRALQVELTAHHNQLLWFCSNGQPLEMSQLAHAEGEQPGPPTRAVFACWGGNAKPEAWVRYRKELSAVGARHRKPFSAFAPLQGAPVRPAFGLNQRSAAKGRL